MSPRAIRLFGLSRERASLLDPFADGLDGPAFHLYLCDDVEGFSDYGPGIFTFFNCFGVLLFESVQVIRGVNIAITDPHLHELTHPLPREPFDEFFYAPHVLLAEPLLLRGSLLGLQRAGVSQSHSDIDDGVVPCVAVVVYRVGGRGLAQGIQIPGCDVGEGIHDRRPGGVVARSSEDLQDRGS